MKRKSLLEALLLESTPPLAATDLGAGARLLVPHGAAFGALQLVRKGVFWDWVRKRPDAYWIPGERTSTHAGVDLAFFVRRGRVFPLPAGLPVRAVLSGRVEWTGRRSDPESTHGIVVNHGGSPGFFLYSHYADVEESVRQGERVRRGQIIGRTRPFSARFPVVLAHFGIGLYARGWGSDPLDPTLLLKRWRVRHPVGAGSSCFADDLNRVPSGEWEGPGKIRGLVAAATWRSSWKDAYR